VEGSCLFLPRFKEGKNPDASARHIRVSYDSLAALFHLPLKDAAYEMGLCPTTFKKACRRFHIERWPFRDAGVARRIAHFSSTVSSSSNVGPSSSELHRPSGAMFSSAAPQNLSQHASSAINTRSYGEVLHAGTASQHKTSAPFDAPSHIDTWGRALIGKPLAAPSPVLHDKVSHERVSHDAPPLSGMPSDRGVASQGHPDAYPLSGMISFGLPLSSIASSSSNIRASSELHRDCATPLAAVWGETTPRDRSVRGSLGTSLSHVPTPHAPVTGGGFSPEAGPPRELSCIEAVMECLDVGCPISEADVKSMVSD